MSTELNNLTEQEVSIDLKKREFMGRMGKYAVVGAGMATLMTPTDSSANCYGRSHHGRNSWKPSRKRRAAIKAKIQRRRAAIKARRNSWKQG